MVRRPAVIALVAIGAIVVAGLTWTRLHSSGIAAAGAASALVPPRPAATAGAAPQTSATASAEELPVGRDPFAGAPASAVSAPATTPHVVEKGAPETPVLAPTESAVPRPSPSGTPSAAPAVTVTVTAATGPTYVGLYAWNGSRASFRVDALTYSVAVGAHFGPGLQFTAVVRGDPPCARVTHAKGSFTLCPGQVTALP